MSRLSLPTRMLPSCTNSTNVPLVAATVEAGLERRNCRGAGSWLEVQVAADAQGYVLPHGGVSTGIDHIPQVRA